MHVGLNICLILVGRCPQMPTMYAVFTVARMCPYLPDMPAAVD